MPVGSAGRIRIGNAYTGVGLEIRWSNPLSHSTIWNSNSKLSKIHRCSLMNHSSSTTFELYNNLGLSERGVLNYFLIFFGTGVISNGFINWSLSIIYGILSFGVPFMIMECVVLNVYHAPKNWLSAPLFGSVFSFISVLLSEFTGSGFKLSVSTTCFSFIS